ncbi:hypothetical protein SB861_48290, partial [Paraburkholderia sp. SIMBA_049]
RQRRALPSTTLPIYVRRTATRVALVKACLLFPNGLLQRTLGFARLSRTDAKHSLRNNLVRNYSQVAG